MKKTLTVLFVLALAAAGRAQDVTTTTSPPPAAVIQLEPTETTYDAGKVERGVPVKHTFVLKNSGPTELAIDAKPG